jgi:hypothetical protein
MPLDRPFAYLISYDLKQSADKYAPFIAEIQKSERWWHFITNTWVVLRRDALVELSAKLRPLIFQTDQLLIMPAKGPADGWLPPEAWKWINDYIPKEW